jgi:ubiquitin carboxyl-terminal hydrolase 10
LSFYFQSDKIKSIEDALRSLTSRESIQGYTCPKTKQMVDASYQTFLEQLPPILILHLKLFVYDKDGGSKKLVKKIDYPIDLDLPRDCLHIDRGDKNKYSKSYKLLSGKYSGDYKA